MKVKSLSLKQIYLKDERFRISYHFQLKKLIFSLKEVGLLSPLIVTCRDDRIILVSGWKRVLACQKLSLSPLPSLFVEDDDDLKVFLLAFHENWATREFSLLEKAEILAKLKKFGTSESDIVRHFLPLLNIPQTFAHFDLFLSFSEFGSDVKKAISARNMPFTSLKLFSELTPAERQLLLPLLLPLGQNKQKEILECLLEISRKNDISAENVINSKEVQDILTSEKLTPIQKADRVRHLLRRIRFPTLSSWMESFDSWLKRMEWPEEISLGPSRFFEEENISLSFNFKDRKELKGRLQRLQQLASKKEFSELFKDL